MGTNFTPGPWEAIRADIYDQDETRWSVLTVGEKQFFIATIENGAPGDTMDTEAVNAHLIAAAPTMFAELESIRQLANDAMEGNDSIGAVKEIITRAETALTKATGPA